MSEPLAYLLTWPTYSSWLHGDERGSVDRAHNVPGTPLLAPDARRVRREAARRKHEAVRLDAAGRRIVGKAIADHCRQRGWELFTAAVRASHVHVVVGAAGATPERMMSQFKAWATRRLREAGRVAQDARVWAYHGSTRYLWDTQSLNRAVAYVAEGQDVPR